MSECAGEHCECHKLSPQLLRELQWSIEQSLPEVADHLDDIIYEIVRETDVNADDHAQMAEAERFVGHALLEKFIAILREDERCGTRPSDGSAPGTGEAARSA